MKLTCKDRCLRYLINHEGQFIASGEMQRLASQKSTYTPATVARELRKLAEDGQAEVKLIKNHAHYRYVRNKAF